MDFKRSCYSCKVRLTPQGPLFDLRWFFAPPKAKLFPAVHFGLSREWFDYSLDFGEVPGTKIYDKGANTSNKKGRCYRGKKEWFASPGVTPEILANSGPQVDHCTSCPAKGARLGLKGIHQILTYNAGQFWPTVSILPYCLWFSIICPDSTKNVIGQFIGSGPFTGGYVSNVVLTPTNNRMQLDVDLLGGNIFWQFDAPVLGASTWPTPSTVNPFYFSDRLQHAFGDWFDDGTTIEIWPQPGAEIGSNLSGFDNGFDSSFGPFSLTVTKGTFGNIDYGYGKPKIAFKVRTNKYIVRLSFSVIAHYSPTPIIPPFEQGFDSGFGEINYTDPGFDSGFSPGLGSLDSGFGFGFE